jgi:hypothetical protein
MADSSRVAATSDSTNTDECEFLLTILRLLIYLGKRARPSQFWRRLYCRP